MDSFDGVGGIGMGFVPTKAGSLLVISVTFSGSALCVQARR